MKKTTILVTVLLTALASFMGCTKSAKNGDEAGDSSAAATEKPERKVLYWYDPMNPTVRFQHAGKSPFMDMDLQPMYADEDNQNANIVSIDPAMVQNIGVVMAPVERRKLTRTINTYGVVTPDEKSVSDINTRVSGWLERLRFDYTGMEVHKGQPMAEIYSPELIAAEQEFLQAVNFASVSGNTMTQSKTLINSARERLAFFGMSEPQIDEVQKTGTVINRVVIHSMQDGVILEKDVYEGQKITAGQTLFRVADLRRVWIQADVFKIDMPFLKTGSPATVTYDRAGSYRGTVDFIYPEVDPTARSVKARISLANLQMAMKIGQYVDVAIHSPISYDAVAVPAQAVINTGLRQVVAVALGEGKFEMRDVKLGVYADGFYAVKEGLSEGETIVTSGQFLIDSDANLKSADASLGGGMPGMNMSEPAQTTRIRHKMEEMNKDSSSVQKNSTEN
jgi:RND family efflux transporter MFP subunit